MYSQQEVLEQFEHDTYPPNERGWFQPRPKFSSPGRLSSGQNTMTDGSVPASTFAHDNSAVYAEQVYEDQRRKDSVRRLYPTRSPADFVSDRERGISSVNETLVRGPKGTSPAVETLVRDFEKPGRINRGNHDQDFELSDSVQRLDPTRMSADFVYARTREHDFEQPGRFYRALDQDLEQK